MTTEQNNETITKNICELFTSRLNESATSLIIRPEIRKNEEDTVSSLKKSSPFIVASKRFDYKIKVNQIKQNENQLMIDYKLLNVDTKEFKKNIIQSSLTSSSLL